MYEDRRHAVRAAAVQGPQGHENCGRFPKLHPTTTTTTTTTTIFIYT